MSHKNFLISAVITVVFGFSISAYAQEPSASKTSDAGNSALVQAPTKVNGPACVLGAHAGIDPADATTAASIVCSELRQLKVPAAGPYEGPVVASEVYRIEMSRLGRLIMLSLTHEAPQGVPKDSRTLQLNAIEDVSVGASRIATALVKKQSLEQTRRVDNIVSSEATTPQTMRSRLLFGLGIGGAYPVGLDATPGYGGELILQHQGSQYAVGGTLRIMGGDLRMINLSLGGRFFLMPTDIAPFIGGGLSLQAIEVETSSRSYDNGGLGAQLEVGVEAMRFNNSRLGFFARADFPFFNLTGDNYDSSGNPTPEKSQYIVPIGIGAYYLFD